MVVLAGELFLRARAIDMSPLCSERLQRGDKTTRMFSVKIVRARAYCLQLKWFDALGFY